MGSIRKLVAGRLFAFWIGVGSISPIYANTIVVSSTTLDIAMEQKFDEAIVTLSGPNSYNAQFNLPTGSTQLRIEDLGGAESGYYSYQIQYIQQGKIEFITDSKTGRQGSARNTGNIEVKSGYFNIRDNEFVTAEAIENDAEISVAPVNEIPTRKFESSAEYHQGQ